MPPRLYAEEMASGALCQQSHDDAELEETEKVSSIRDDIQEGYLASSVENVASDLSKLFGIDSATQLSHLEEVVDSLLAYSGECCSATAQIREESNKLLFISMPQFYEKRAGMQKLFKQIDALEEFITSIKSNVDEMEQSVLIAEKQLGSKNLKKIMSSIPIPSFFSQRKQPQNLTSTDTKKLEPQVPSIFKTDNFLTCEKNGVDNSRDSPSGEISDISS